MLNAGSFRDRYTDPAKRAQLKPETIWEIEQGQTLTAASVYEASLIRSAYYAHMRGCFEPMTPWPCPQRRFGPSL